MLFLFLEKKNILKDSRIDPSLREGEDRKKG